jgi:hypothetical protein
VLCNRYIPDFGFTQLWKMNQIWVCHFRRT